MNKFEKYCLSLPIQSRVRLMNALVASVNEDFGRSFEKMHNAIVKVIGGEVISKSRKRPLVIGRAILAYEFSLAGLSENAIGEFLQRDHSTCHKMKSDMKFWLQSPQIFKRENDYYVKFLKELNNETDR